MSIEAMKQALEALECLFGIPEQFTGKGGGDVAVWTLGGSYRAQQAIPVLRQAIEKAEKKEPKKWVEVECPLCGEMAVAHTHPVLTTPQPQQAEKQEPWVWMPAPIKTQWGDEMVVADLAIDKDHTVSVYCERDQAARVEAMFRERSA